MTEERGEVALRWLRALAGDVLEHECCRGCQVNAAQALESVGLLAEVLGRLGLPDPRQSAPGDGVL